MTDLKNIIFDLGAVLLNIDYSKTEKAFNSLGFSSFDTMFSQYQSDGLFTQLETGRITNEDFYAQLLQASDADISINQINEAWNAMLLDFREESLAYVENLSQRYQIYLLSNTNAIHQQAFRESFTSQTGRSSLDDYFIKAYYSHEIGLRKPNEDIFEFVLKDAHLTAAQTLFIDDSYNNIATAKKMGFITHLLNPGQMIENLPYYR